MHQLVAAFGLSGAGQPLDSQRLAQAPLNLEQTGPADLTFTLGAEPVCPRLELKLGGHAGHAHYPSHGATLPPSFIQPIVYDMRVTASGLPTCTQLVDVLTLQATNTLTPSILAKTQASVLVLPDPATVQWPM